MALFRSIAIIEASRYGDSARVMLLLNRGANINEKNIIGDTALHVACQEGNLATVKLLLEHKASVNKKNKCDETALMMASKKGYLEIVKLLLEYKASVNKKNDCNKTALMMVSEKGYLEIAKLLLEHGADSNICAMYGWTALMDASRNGHVEIVRLLLENKPHYGIIKSLFHNNKKNMNESFFWAFNGKYIEIMELLLDHGADVNYKDIHDNTYLIHSSFHGIQYLVIVKLLLDYNADCNIKNKDGKTALDIARQKDCEELINILQNYPLEKERKKYLRIITDLQKDNTSSFYLLPDELLVYISFFICV